MNLAPWLIFAVLTSGFVLCRKHPVHWLKFHRYDGQSLYLKSAEYGLYCLLWASGCVLTYDALLVGGHPARLDRELFIFFANKISSESFLFLASLLTLLMPYLWVRCAHVRLSILGRLALEKSLLDREKADKHTNSAFEFTPRDRALLGYIEDLCKDSPINAFLYKAYIEKSPTMLTLADRKVYVCLIISMGEPNETQGMDQEISVIPIISGYRDKDDLSVKFTTYYEKVGHPLTLVIRQKNILSATHFDFDAYQKF